MKESKGENQILSKSSEAWNQTNIDCTMRFTSFPCFPLSGDQSGTGYKFNKKLKNNYIACARHSVNISDRIRTKSKVASSG